MTEADPMRISGLIKRNDIYYIRKRIPTSLKPVVGLWIVSRSLKTRNPHHAFIRFLQYDTILRRIFESSLQMAKLDRHLTKRYFHEMLRRWMGR